MHEDILQYIWKFRFFNCNDLRCTNGDELSIINPGILNLNQGPDFADAKIRINDILWAGNVEIHTNSSDWDKHHHSSDNNYKNIILHVVWNHDKEIKGNDGNDLHTLELQNRVSKLLLEKYRQLMQNSRFIPCEKMKADLSELGMTAWKQRLAAERLLLKSNDIFEILQKNNFHWEETFWWLIASNFGLKINSETFKNIAQSLPLTLLSKHKNNILQLEALLFGQAGLLEKEFEEKYPAMLKKEYEFYRKKYRITPLENNLHFLRMRPANFPTVRLSQLAALIRQSEHLFSKIRETESVKDLKKMFEVEANDYWHYHYIFDEESSFKIKRLGRQMTENILINTVAPVVFCYGLHHNLERYKERAIKWLEEISPEKNHITKGFEQIGYSNKSAFDSQALIQLKNFYCDKKRCLKCTIGNSLLKKA